MEAKAFKKALQKNSLKNDAQNEPKLVPKGSQNGAKIVKNEVLEASCFKGGSQEASRPPPGSILERFWEHFGTIFVNFCTIFWLIFACILQQHVANQNVQIRRKRQKNAAGSFQKQLLSSCHLAWKSSLANVNELSGPRQYRLRQDRLSLIHI